MTVEHEIRQQWHQRAQQVREVVRSFGPDIPDCLPGEEFDCGRNEISHLCDLLGVALAYLEYTAIDLNAKQDGQALDVITHAYANESERIKQLTEHGNRPGLMLVAIGALECSCD